MYLFAFIFLLLTIIGVYTQVFASQTARIFGDQAVIGQQLLVWHNAATRFARANPTYGMTAVGCRVTPGVTDYAGLIQTTACATTLGTADLPTGYTTSYKWESIIFRDATNNQRMIVTFVPPDATDAQAPRPPAGVANSELLKQLQNAAPGSLTVGSTSGACPNTTMIPASQPGGGVTLRYPVPQSSVVPIVCYVPIGAVAAYTVL
jgi:hypothetical protein